MLVLPLVARVSPAMMLISVVLPAPLGPSKAKNSPCSTSRSTPAKACKLPKRLCICVTSIAGIIVKVRKVANAENSKNIHHAIADRDARTKETASDRYSNRYGLVFGFQLDKYG